METAPELTLEQTQDCIRRFLNGDSSAIDPIYRAHYRSLFLRASAFLRGDNTAAEECVQNTFLKAIKYLDSYERSKPIGHWLMRILRNAVTDYLNARKDVSLLTEEEERTLAAPALMSESEQKRELALEQERAAVVRKAMESLPEDQRRHLHLFHFMNLSHADIAKCLNITEENSRQKLRRIREKLKACLDPGLLKSAG